MLMADHALACGVLAAAGTVAQRFRLALPAAAARRRFRGRPREDDIADPYGREDAAYRRAFDEVAAAVDRISVALRPPG